MRNFKLFVPACLLFLILIIVMNGCREISQGQQRKKFEYLYKMNNYTSLFREYTGGISFAGDLELYQKRMRKLYDDVEQMTVIEGYKASSDLKTEFLFVINENVKTSDNLKQKNLPEMQNIRNEYEIQEMNQKVDDLIEDLNTEISRVGKE